MSASRNSFDDYFRAQESYYGDDPSDGLVKCIAQNNIEPCKALDAGCGHGRNALWLASKGFDVLAVDNSVEAISQVQDRAAARGITVKTCLGDIRKIPFPRQHFGLIVLQTTLNHIPKADLTGLCDKIFESLIIGGALYSVCFTKEDPGARPGLEATSECSHLVSHYFEAQELSKLFSSLKILEYTEYRKIDATHGPVHYHGKAKLVGRRI